MKKIVFIISLFSIGLFAQEKKDYSANVATLDSTIATLYTVVSGEKGVKRDWVLFKHLFHNNAKLIPAGTSSEGKKAVRYMSSDDYITTSGNWFDRNGFYQKETQRTVETFGNITHVFSSYESYKTKGDETPFLKGVNSIQLFNDGTRWWIINLYWAQESKNKPMPKPHLRKKE
ncbi:MULTISPECIES: hypothetical protein [Winogradskyella]|uniref:hypothetical protein n=1 Tax=Winogradskyella TaxID=286104 RepID=UPI0015C72680|nr:MULTISPECIES: hypothetical protein [Winogradskyella]QXP78973.1 hypothetical protein H0I32_17525 [Winogradskyella sp. HaHa_3_26]